MLKVSEQLLQGLRGDDRDKMKNLLLSNTILLDKLKEIMYNMMEGKRGTLLVDYDTPSWSHKQAHLNGELAALQKVIELITITDRDDRPATQQKA